MRALRYLRDAAVFAPCYVALDWASYIDPVGPFNITPWNPQPALALAWMTIAGLAHLPVVFATIVGADFFVRGAPGGTFITLLSSAVLAAGYATLAWLLRSLLRSKLLRYAAKRARLKILCGAADRLAVGDCIVFFLQQTSAIA